MLVFSFWGFWYSLVILALLTVSSQYLVVRSFVISFSSVPQCVHSSCSSPTSHGTWVLLSEPGSFLLKAFLFPTIAKCLLIEGHVISGVLF